MKVKVLAKELTGGEIDFVSLVKHGANRSPFKIVKNDGPALSLIDQIPELAKLQQSLAASGSTARKEITTVNINGVFKAAGDEPEPARKSSRSNAEITEIVKHRRRKAALNARLQKLWERPDQEGADRLETHILDEIEKADIELAALGYEEPDQFAESSAFFFRGGSSVHSAISDSAFENVNSLGVIKQADLRKAEQQIDLSTPLTQADFDDQRGIDRNAIAKIDLGGMKL